MALGRVVAAASETTGSLKKLIKLSLREDRTVPPMTADSYIRGSSLPSMCPREEVLAALEGIERKDKQEADLKLIFAHGKGLHYILQNEVLAETGCLIGIWRCVDCAKQHGVLDGPITETQTLVRKPKKCEACGSVEFHYQEQHFTDKEHNFGGHPDGFLILQGFPGIGIVECKSIGSHRVWEVKHTPDMSHVIQAQSYMWLTGLQWAKILYWEKGGQGMSALIEHTVERDEDTISRIKELIMSIRNGIRTEVLPTRVCENATCPKAKKCPLVERCFAREDTLAEAT